MAIVTSGKDKLMRHLRIFIGGYNLSGDARTFSSLDNKFEGVDVSGWSEFVRNFLVDGWRQVGVRGFQALLNDATGRAFAQLKDAENTSRLSLLFGGGGEPAVGDPAYLMSSIQLSDLAGWDGRAAAIGPMDFLPDAAQYSNDIDNPFGVVLQAETSLSATTTNSSHDNAASSANGWHANIHVTATSSGNFAFVIEHSSNDSAWSTLGTFTTTGGSVGSEQLSGTGTVNRYTRVVSTRTAGTVTAVVTFARN